MYGDQFGEFVCGYWDLMVNDFRPQGRTACLHKLFTPYRQSTSNLIVQKIHVLFDILFLFLKFVILTLL